MDVKDVCQSKPAMLALILLKENQLIETFALYVVQSSTHGIRVPTCLLKGSTTRNLSKDHPSNSVLPDAVLVMVFIRESSAGPKMFKHLVQSPHYPGTQQR